jgi:hypothetical protein
MAKPSVSICTVSMNRLHHIQKTLPVNLKENDSPGVNFILLDYNSSDGLEEYIRDNFSQEIKSGKLVYYRYKQALSFNHAHSKNMVFRLAEGDILCSVDADNYAGRSFGKFVQDTFATQSNVCLTGLNNKWVGDASGKLCVSKGDFMGVTGFDESFKGYGFEDFDIVNRLQLNGCKPYTINRPDFLQVITHERDDRVNNSPFYQQLRALYVHYIDPSTSELLYLFDGNKCINAIVVNKFTKNCDDPYYTIQNTDEFSSQFDIVEGWQPGTWVMESGKLYLSINELKEVCFSRSLKGYELFENEKHVYHPVTDNSMKLEAISFYTETKNRWQMMNNLYDKKIRVNHIYGKGVVYKNFNEHEPIKV